MTIDETAATLRSHITWRTVVLCIALVATVATFIAVLDSVAVPSHIAHATQSLALHACRTGIADASELRQIVHYLGAHDVLFVHHGRGIYDVKECHA